MVFHRNFMFNIYILRIWSWWVFLFWLSLKYTPTQRIWTLLLSNFGLNCMYRISRVGDLKEQRWDEIYEDVCPLLTHTLTISRQNIFFCLLQRQNNGYNSFFGYIKLFLCKKNWWYVVVSSSFYVDICLSGCIFVSFLKCQLSFAPMVGWPLFFYLLNFIDNKI